MGLPGRGRAPSICTQADARTVWGPRQPRAKPSALLSCSLSPARTCPLHLRLPVLGVPENARGTRRACHSAPQSHRGRAAHAHLVDTHRSNRLTVHSGGPSEAGSHPLFIYSWRLRRLGQARSRSTGKPCSPRLRATAFLPQLRARLPQASCGPRSPVWLLVHCFP